MDFKDQVVVVTGGTRGIGLALSKSFIAAGAKVIATYVSNDEQAEKVKIELGANLTIKKFNVAIQEQVEEFYNWLESSFEKLDVLINNSGIRKDNIVASMDEKSWDDVLNINLKGSFLMSKYAVPLMMKKRYGRIINMSSISGIKSINGQANYSASKAGQIAMGKVLAKEVAKKGITVNCVLPGFIETELIEDLDDALINQYKKEIPMRRFGKVEEVAHGVLFLASSNASYITGSNLEIGGGL